MPKAKTLTQTEAEPELVLQPAIDRMSREEVEAHLEEVRARRMTAAIEYQIGTNAKIDRANTVLGRRMEQQYQMLEKEILKLDSLDEKIQKRLNTIESLNQEMAYNITMRIEDTDALSEDSDDE